jgi:hypothetical protein
MLGRRARRVGSRLRVGSGPLLPSVFGGEGRSPSVALSAAMCLAPQTEWLWCCFRCRLLPLERGCPSAARVSVTPCAGQPRPGPSRAAGCTEGSHNTSYSARAVFVF